MGENSKIQWTDHTMNFWIGCTPVSGACDHCYAETLSKRYGWAEWGVGKPRHRTSAANWRKPYQWNNAGMIDSRRPRVFSNSLSDWADAEVPNEWRDDAMTVIQATRNLDWLLLTKRPKVMRDYLRRWAGIQNNIWVGVTAENQEMMDLRWRYLRQIPATVRFLSIEPMLGPVILPADFLELGSRAWVIVGGESGKGWRPIDTDAVLSLRDQSESAGVPFFFKQWGEFEPARAPADRYPENIRHYMPDDGFLMIRHGKKATGRNLDGLLWSQFP